MTARLLVAGMGNVFLGDDGFGCAVARALADAPPPGARVVDFGVRGFDLACDLTSGIDAAIIVDATSRGGTAGTLYVIDPEAASIERGTLDAHGLEPGAVLALARSLGALPKVCIVGCEPARLTDDDDEPTGELSDAVRAAVPSAVALVRELVRSLLLEMTSEVRGA